MNALRQTDAERREADLRKIREAGEAEGLSPRLIAEADASMRSAFAMADAMDFICGAITGESGRRLSLVPCDECDGMGEWDEGPINTGGPAPVDPIYRQVTCPQCDGTGRVEQEVEPITLDDLEATR